MKNSSLIVCALACLSFGSLFLEPDLLDRPPSSRCAGCHGAITGEWNVSRHSKAWSDGEFALRTAERTRGECLQCHIPAEVLPGKKPAARKGMRGEGVNCFACHFKGGSREMGGPLQIFLAPHPAGKDPVFETSEYCGGCHAEAFKEWRSSGSDKVCQDCHMPDLGKGELIGKWPYTLLHLPKPRHDHSFPPLVAQDDDVEVRLVEGPGPEEGEGKSCGLAITNIGVPHNLPTAEHGDTQLHLVARLTFAGGAETRVTKTFSGKDRTALAFGVPLMVPLAENVVLKKVAAKLFVIPGWSDEREAVKTVEFALSQ